MPYWKKGCQGIVPKLLKKAYRTDLFFQHCHCGHVNGMCGQYRGHCRGEFKV